MKNKQQMQTESEFWKASLTNDLLRARNIYMEIQENQMIFKNRINTLEPYKPND